jgi:hypothetical protein
MDDRFYKGIEEFNSGRYFEAHEVLEDLWHEYRETDRTFIQGLIQISAGFYHFQCENWKGAASQLLKGIKKLEPFRPVHLGVELTGFLVEIQQCLNTVGELMERKNVDPRSLKISKLNVGESHSV